MPSKLRNDYATFNYANVLNTLKVGGVDVIKADGTLQYSRRAILSTAVDTTLTAADSGKTVIVTGVDKIMSLPPTAAGLHFIFILANAGLSAGAGLKISPDAADQIAGNGFTLADNKDAILAGTGDRAGDMISLVADGTDGWYIVAVVGTWTREA